MWSIYFPLFSNIVVNIKFKRIQNGLYNFDLKIATTKKTELFL